MPGDFKGGGALNDFRTLTLLDQAERADGGYILSAFGSVVRGQRGLTFSIRTG